jgi:hypothetical protein
VVLSKIKKMIIENKKISIKYLDNNLPVNASIKYHFAEV